jgi:uncharacterized protein DUF5916/cellulose/xylan binding protein with CBM9 domain
MWPALLAATLATAVGIASSRADDAPAPSAPSAVRVTGAVNDEVWRTVTPIDAFVQREPHDGGAPSQRTEFRVAYDATTLFVKVRAYDTDPDRIVTNLTRRDLDSPCDWIHILIDSYHDRRTAYEFAVNPSGVKMDRYWFNDTSKDDSWDAVWDVSVSRDRQGWSAEFRIPFSQLRFTPAQTNTFGFAVSRQIGRLNETSTWPLLSRSANGYVSSFGELDGLSMDASPKRLELVPYTVANLTRQPTDGNPLVRPSAPGVALGMDLKYALTPGLTFTGTINPDFGQVEADPEVVNLTAFETFFAERRPFFVEGSGTFNFGIDCSDPSCPGLFYSRRIGRSPQGLDDLPSGDNVYTDTPSQTTILGAGKLTGRIGRYSIGVLQAFTKEEDARVQNGAAFLSQPVEPPTSYTVGRVRREFANQSSVGVMLTSTKRQIGTSLSFLPDLAVTSGVDWDLRFKTRYALTGYWAGSHVHGEPGAIDRLQEDSRHYYQRPDLTSAALDVTRTSLDGDAGMIAISKIGGDHVRFNSNVMFKSPGFDIDDVGFLRRADQRNVNNWLQIRSDKPTRRFRSRTINFNQYAAWNSDGNRLYSGGNVNANATFVNNWEMGGGYGVQALGFDDRIARGGPGVIAEGFNEGWYYVNSDNRRALALSAFTGAGSNGVGSSWLEIQPGLTYRPLPALTFSPAIRVAKNIFDSQWVAQVTDTANHYVFSRLNQTTVALTARLNYTMTPNLSLQLYAQPFVSAGAYDGFKELVNGRSRDYAGRYAPYAYDLAVNGDPDFNVKSFRTTNVLRWEYKPGSTLFVVWQQARENDAVPGGFRFGRDMHDVFGVAPRNVFLVKLAYWLNY